MFKAVAVLVLPGVAAVWKCSESFVEEFTSETCTLPFVPQSGCRQMSIRLFRESDCAVHSFFLISAITASAGRLCLPLAS